MRTLKIIGYLLIASSVVLIYLFSSYDIFKNSKNLKYFFPIASIGFFCLAFVAWNNDRKASEEYNFNILTFKSSVSIFVFIGAILLFLTVII